MQPHAVLDDGHDVEVHLGAPSVSFWQASGASACFVSENAKLDAGLSDLSMAPVCLSLLRIS
jgi:hypothetical protein